VLQTSRPTLVRHAGEPRRTTQSLLHRVALGAAASAMFAALVAAGVTSVFAAYLTRRAHDRRLQDAAQILAVELDDDPTDQHSLAYYVADELRETRHTGIAFAIFDRTTQQLLEGDERVPAAFDTPCTHSPTLRACGAPARGNLWVVAATGRLDVSWLYAISSGLAALLAGVGAWLASRPIARWLMGPLSELRQQVGAIDFASTYSACLGPAAGVAEVDALRDAITELLGRVERALRQAERFAAEAAHELRTPLTAIRGELELLCEEKTLPPDAEASLARVQRRVIELGTMLERLLVLALPDESQWSASELISLQELAEDLILLMPDAERARVRLAKPKGDVVVRGDSALLGLLFSNGLGNALKFGGLVSIATFEDASDVVLRLDDDGPGIPVEQRTAAFEPFVRLAAIGKRAVAGHGLGLALIAHVARRHGGVARFVDGPPGAHLEIRLPRQKA
jgi:two-component system, OmpR family, sensor kinase